MSLLNEKFREPYRDADDYCPCCFMTCELVEDNWEFLEDDLRYMVRKQEQKIIDYVQAGVFNFLRRPTMPLFAKDDSDYRIRLSYYEEFIVYVDNFMQEDEEFREAVYVFYEGGTASNGYEKNLGFNPTVEKLWQICKGVR